jgi:hypothetical protein
MLFMPHVIALMLVVAGLATQNSEPFHIFSRCDEFDDPNASTCIPDGDVLHLMQQHFSMIHTSKKYDNQFNDKSVHELGFGGSSSSSSTTTSHDPRIFCWSVVRPNSHEVELLKEHLASNLISGCDGWAIYSNVSFTELLGQSTATSLFSYGQSFSSAAINGSMSLENGGPVANGVTSISTPLNTPMFIQVWRHIIREGVFQNYDWIVKVDIDTVVFPHRLRQLLRKHHQISQTPVRLTTQGENLTSWTGAIEILSRSAVEVYAEKQEFCESKVDYHDKSEDWYLELCLYLLGVPYVSEPGLLSQNPSSNSQTGKIHSAMPLCATQQTAAYHPLKSVQEFRSCLQVVMVMAEGTSHGQMI